MKARGVKALMVSLAVTFTGIAGASAQALPDTIRLGAFGQGYGQPYGTATLAIAHVKGFIADEFKDTPVKFEWNYYSGTGPAINEAIANNQLDFAQYGGLPNIIGRANDLPTRVIQSYGVTNVIAVARTGLPINSFKDIKGRRVTVSKGTILHWALLKALEANGLTTRDITLIDLKAADQLAALAAGSVDVSIGTTSLLPLEDKGIVKVFYNSKTGTPKAAGFGAITVTDAFRTKYPDATQRVSRGLVRAGQWLSKEENREEALQIWAKSGTPIDALRRDYEGQDLKLAFNPLIDDDIPAALGWLYVAEGSNLGAAFLLKEAERLGLSETFGACHLAAAPEGRGLHWRTFTAALDALQMAKLEEERVIEGARAAFRCVQKLVDGLLAQRTTG